MACHQEFDFTGDLGAFTLDDDGIGDNFITFTDVAIGSYDVAVIIYLNVTNYGSSRRGYTAMLLIDGEPEHSQMVYLSPGQTKNVIFTVYRATPGNYAVSLGGSGGWVTVVETGYTVVEGSETTGGGLSTGGIIAAAVGAGLGVFFATRRRQY